MKAKPNRKTKRIRQFGEPTKTVDIPLSVLPEAEKLLDQWSDEYIRSLSGCEAST